MWVEEYADREACDAFYKALKEDKTFHEIHDGIHDVWSLMVEGSFKDGMYTERARFQHRVRAIRHTHEKDFWLIIS
jgi:hypothetical protein